HPENDRPKGARLPRPVPSLAAAGATGRVIADLSDGGTRQCCICVRTGRRPFAVAGEVSPDLRVGSLVGGDRGDFRRGLGVVQLLLVALERLDQIGDGAGAEQPGDGNDDPYPESRRPRWGHIGTTFAELRR